MILSKLLDDVWARRYNISHKESLAYNDLELKILPETFRFIRNTYVMLEH